MAATDDMTEVDRDLALEEGEAYVSIREIDTSKKEVTLGHDIGAGAPCLKCGDACTGLELHYWRKICKICKCGPEDHRIADGDREHCRKIGRLFDDDHVSRYNTLKPMTVSKTNLLNAPQQNGDGAEDEAGQASKAGKPDGPDANGSKVTFEWTPSGASVETATRYMEMLPKESQPIQGTEGADSRKKQMHVQLPAHDQAPELCQNLSEKETRDMEDFVKEYKTHAVGIGHIQEVQVHSGGSTFQLTGAPPAIPPKPAKKGADFEASDAIEEDEFGIASNGYDDAAASPSVTTAYLHGTEGAHPGAPDSVQEGDIVASNGYGDTASSPPLSPEHAPGTDASVGTDQEYWPGPPPPTPTSEEYPGELENGRAPQMTSEGVGTDYESPTGSASKWQCVKCNDNMRGGDVAVFAERAGVDKCWHPGCFRCTTCSELLVDLIYFFKGDHIYCGRHYADTLKPRCAACDELIFALSYTQAEDMNWHVNHFCCFECDTPLGGQQYVAKDTHPYCMECHSKKFAKMCTSCGQKIGAGVPRLSHSEHHWHADDDCFRCSNCKMSLVGKSFLPKEGYIFCSTKCKKQLLR